MQELYSNEARTHQLRVLLHSRTVIEGEECLATGVISFIEGDLMDVELPEYEQFQLGERVKVTVYSPVGIIVFATIIIARHQGALLFIYPPNQQYRFIDRRENTRVKVRKHGFVNALCTEDGEVIPLTNPTPMHLYDISLNGLGFVLLSDESLAVDSRVRAELHIGFTLSCELRIVRFEMRDGVGSCGAELITTSEADARGLRAFILKEQIESYAELKAKKKRLA